MLKRVLSSLCCSAFAVAFCLVMPASAQSSDSSNHMNTASSSKHSQKSSSSSQEHSANRSSSSQPSQQKMKVSKEAVHALRLTDEARQALISKDQKSATKDVDQAVALLNQVEQKAPSTKRANTHVVPIYAELEQTSFLQPVLSAKNETAEQKTASNSSSASNTNSGQKKANNSNSAQESASNSQSSALPQSDQPAGTQPEVVNWVEGGYSYIALDVDSAREHLKTAQQELKANEPGKADLELARAEQSVDTGTVETNMPLVRARENLSLASVEAKSGKYSQAGADLKAAASALKNYGQDSKAPHAKDAANLGSQINSAAAKVKSDHSMATQNIDKWWNKIADWTGEKSS